MAHAAKLALVDDSGVSTTDLLVNTATPSFEGSAEPNSNVELFVSDGSTTASLGTATVDVSGDWSYTVAAGS